MDDLTEETVPSEASAPEQPSDGAAESDPFDSGADSFDRAYVERLRKESAGYRTKAKEYESYASAFEPYGDEDRAVWQEAMKRFNEDPKSGAEYLDAIAKAVLAEYTEAAASGDEGDEPKYLTQSDVDRIFSEREAAAEQATEVARIESEAKELGYDTASDEYTYLLTVASRLPSGSVAEAHAKIEAAYEARIQARLAELQAEADGGPTVPGEGAGAPPSTERPLRTWADADAAFRARMEAEKRR